MTDEKKMEILNLEVTKRKLSGKEYSKKIRNVGVVPAVVYGRNEEPLSIQVEEKEIIKVLKSKTGEHSILNISFKGNGSPNLTAMIQDIQRDILKPRILHVDFKIISLKERTKATIPLHVSHEPLEGKNIALLEQHLWELELECLPLNIPNSIEVNLSNLKMGQHFTVADLIVDADIKVLADPHEVLFVYNETREVVIPGETDEALFAAERSQPEVVRKKKEE